MLLECLLCGSHCGWYTDRSHQMLVREGFTHFHVKRRNASERCNLPIAREEVMGKFEQNKTIGIFLGTQHHVLSLGIAVETEGRTELRPWLQLYVCPAVL